MGILVHSSQMGQILCVSVYGHVSDLNATKEMLRLIAMCVARCGKPFVSGGDFNASPESIADIMHELNVPCHTMAPFGTTCQATSHASCIDFFVVHPKGWLLCNTPQRVLQGIISPHDPVQLSLRITDTANTGLFLDRPRKPSNAMHVVGPRLELQAPATDFLREVLYFANNIGATQSQALTKAPSEEEQTTCHNMWTKWCRLAQVEISAATGDTCLIPMALAISSKPVATCFAIKQARRATPSIGLRWLIDSR